MDFIGLRTRHDRWPRQVFLELLEGHNTVLGPLKPFPLVDQEIERSTSIRRPGNESIQGRDHSSKLLDLLGVLRWF